MLPLLGAYPEALPYAEKGLQAKQTAFGIDSPATAHAHSILGSALRGSNQLERALATDRRAYQLQLSSAGADDPGTIVDQATVAEDLLLLGRSNEALPVARGALDRVAEVTAVHDAAFVRVIAALVLAQFPEAMEEAQSLAASALQAPDHSLPDRLVEPAREVIAGERPTPVVPSPAGPG